MAMNEIEPNLWLGAFTSLTAQKTLKKNNVTHILSLLTPDIPGQESQYELGVKDFKHLRIDIDDIEDENIMQYFDRTNAYIQEGLDSGGILVHCMAGVSRSSTIVAAYLMQKYLWNAQKTVEYLKTKRPVVNPNESFYQQLEVYFNCGFEVTVDRPEYRMLLLQQQAENAKFNGTVSIPELQTDAQKDQRPLDMPTYVVLSRLCYKLFNHSKTWDNFQLVISTEANGEQPLALRDIPSEKLAPLREQSPKLVLRDIQTHRDILLTPRMLSDSAMELRCKKCRQTLTTTRFLLSHAENRNLCSQYFTEPVSWMRDELEKGELEGKLACPKCSAKIGSYHWQGSKCSCGKWVTPAIGLQKAKVDEVSTRPSVIHRAKA
jgi:dual specificity phosphatase 12